MPWLIVEVWDEFPSFVAVADDEAEARHEADRLNSLESDEFPFYRVYPVKRLGE